jgi:alpha-D-xyloside xylohydrolase
VLLSTWCFLWSPTEARPQLWEVPPLPRVKYAQAPDGMTAEVGDESLHFSVCRATVIHFVATLEPPGKVRESEPWMLDAKDSCPGAKFQLSETGDAAILTTDKLKVRLSLKWGNVEYSTTGGESLLRERNGEKTFHVEDRFAPDISEGFYGLGQHQSGLFNYRGATVKLAQNNTDVAIPLLLSSKGYALMWNSASMSEVDNRFPLELNISSLAGHSVDYYLVYGPEMDL